MQTITKDKWKVEVWGAATSPGTNDRDTINWNNVAYWGKNVRYHMITAPMMMLTLFRRITGLPTRRGTI